MPTTLAIDDDLALRFRTAVRNAYPKSFGKIKEEVKAAIEDRIKKLEEIK